MTSTRGDIMTEAPEYRTTARIVGAMFLAGMTVYMVGNGLVQSVLDSPERLATTSQGAMSLSAGAALMLLAAAIDAAHGILMLPVLRRHGERLAFGYLAARLLDAALLAGGVILVLVQIPMGEAYGAADPADMASLQALSVVAEQAHVYAYEIGMLALGVAGVMLCYGLYRASLVPRSLAIWGLFGYVTLAFGSIAQTMGFELRLIHTIPGGLWEVFTGVWLLAKGFRARDEPVRRAPVRAHA
jgi:hypothetical protein